MNQCMKNWTRRLILSNRAVTNNVIGDCSIRVLICYRVHITNKSTSPHDQSLWLTLQSIIQYFSGLKLCMMSCLCTQKPRVGV